MTRSIRTLLLGCAAVPLIAGAAAAEPVTAEMVTALIGAEVTTGGGVPTGEYLRFRDFSATSDVYQIDAAALLVPAQADGPLNFLLEEPRISRIGSEGGGVGAQSLQGTDISVLRSILADTFFSGSCENGGAEVLIEGQDVAFWADEDLAAMAGGRARREETRMGYVQVRMVEGPGCSEVIELVSSDVKASTPTGGTARFDELTYAARAGTDSAMGFAASGLLLEGRTGVEVLAVDQVSLQASLTRSFFEMMSPDQDLRQTLLEEISSGMVDLSLQGLRSRLDLLIPGGRIGNFTVPPGHSLAGDMQMKINGTGDAISISGMSAMEGLANVSFETTATLAAGEATDPMSMAAQMQIGATTLALKDRGLDDLLVSATGSDLADLVGAGLHKAGGMIPGGGGRALQTLSDGVTGWISGAMRDGGSVSINPQPAVTPFEMGMLAMSAPVMLVDRLSLETAQAD